MDNSVQPKLTKKQNTLMTVKFILFSISAGVIQLGSCLILREFTNIDKLIKLDALFGNEYGLTYFISLVLSVLWNFTFNRKFTFKSAANVPLAMLMVFAYYLVFTPLSLWWTVQLTSENARFGGQVNQFLTTISGHSITLSQDKIGFIVLLLTMLANLTTEFPYDRYVVYKKSVYTNKLGRKELLENTDEPE